MSKTISQLTHEKVSFSDKHEFLRQELLLQFQPSWQYFSSTLSLIVPPQMGKINYYLIVIQSTRNPQKHNNPSYHEVCRDLFLVRQVPKAKRAWINCKRRKLLRYNNSYRPWKKINNPNKKKFKSSSFFVERLQWIQGLEQFCAWK